MRRQSNLKVIIKLRLQKQSILCESLFVCEPLLLLQMLYIYDKINDSICAEFISELFNKPNLKFGKKWRLAWNKKY